MNKRANKTSGFYNGRAFDGLLFGRSTHIFEVLFLPGDEHGDTADCNTGDA